MKDIIFKADQIADIYEKLIFNDLIKQSEAIYKNLQKSLEKLCVENRITTSNSVYKKIFPFSIIYRVKKGESLKEKLIRKSLFEDIYSENEGEIKKNIYLYMDDLIGFTILVDTSKKLSYFLNFIMKNLDEIECLNFNESKLGELTYYNIKAIYQTELEGQIKKIPFEIQIKSTITSAFTNIQHKLIYKNQDVSILKNNIDLMLKSVTSSVIAIEKVIDSAEESFVNSNTEIEKYYRQKKIQELIHKEIDNEQTFDVFISDIDNIVKRAIEGEILLSNCSTDEKKKVTDKFLQLFSKKSEIDTIEIDTKNVVLKILDSITTINKELIKKVVCYDYYLKMHCKIKFEENGEHIQKLEEIMHYINLLNSRNISIFEKILLDTKYRNIDFISTILSITSEFLEEETYIKEVDIKEIREQAVLFSYGIIEARDVLQEKFLEQEMNILIDQLEKNKIEVFSDEKNSQ
ncbi:nucleotidyltransferase family protein [Mammaliicoccus sciuri]|uniref:hypothetical protein n=1 Tax=Mammaliicoccus sciuri TaxID=1296 RepID=UPI002DB79C05|nr:hypothetical protein [Mammaliicoccus sciuri]MEB8073980.1 hypothetical protein [Mammaliicoccus sciuri]